MKTTASSIVGGPMSNFDKWISINYLSLAHLLAEGATWSEDCYHDALLQVRERATTEREFKPMVVATYGSLLRKEQNRSFRTYNPDPVFWLFQQEHLPDEQDEDNGDNKELSAKTIIAYVKHYESRENYQIFLMRIVHGCANEDIAAYFGITPHAVSDRIYKINRSLRNHFQILTANDKSA